LPQHTSISLSKSGTWNDANADGFAQPGETISYSNRVNNTDNVTANTIAVSDSLGITVTCLATTLNPGDSTSCSASYVIGQDQINAGTVHNDATATARGPQGQTPFPYTTLFRSLPQHTSISLSKSGTWNDANADGFAQPGE